MTNNLQSRQSGVMRRACVRFATSILLVFGVLGLYSGSLLAQPANDNFVAAQVISGVSGSAGGDSTGATEEIGEPPHLQITANGASVWFKWTAPSNTLVTFDTVGSAIEFDTVLAVYTGTSLNNLALVVNDDDSAPNLKSRVTFSAIAGTDYYIALDGYDYGSGSETGVFVLNWFPGAFTPATPGIAGEFNFSAGFYLATEFETIQASVANPDLPGAIVGTPTIRGAVITVTRTRGSSGRVIVSYTTVNTNTAACGDTNSIIGIPGCDYTPTSGDLIFEDYQMSASFIVPVASDRTDVSGTKQVPLILFNPRPAPEEEAVNPGLIAPILGARTNATLNIIELNTTDPTNIRATNFVIERTTYARQEGSSIRVDILMPSGSGGQVRVNVVGVSQRGRYSPGTGSDYADGSDRSFPLDILYTDGTISPILDTADFTTFSTNIQFAVGDRRRGVTIDIASDNIVEFNEDILIYLERIGGQPPIGPNSRALVTIRSNDEPAGALDRDWNPDLVSITTPRFNATPGANNTVRAVAIQQVQGTERTVIGGDFTAYNAFPRNRIARINPDGSLDESFEPQTGANDFVSSIAIYSPFSLANANKIVIGGGFSSVNNIQRNGVARLNPDGSLDATFNPGVGANGIVRSVAIQSDGKVLVAGDFTYFNGVERNGVARLNVDGSVDGSFDPGAGVDGTVWSVAVRDAASTIFVPRSSEGNEFEDVNEIETGSTSGTILIDYDFLSIVDNIRVYYDGIRIFDRTTNGVGQLAIPYGPGTDTKVTVILNEGIGEPGTLWRYTANVLVPPPEPKIFIGGEFVNYDGIYRPGVARLNQDGSLDQAFDVGGGVDGVVYVVAPQNDGRLVIGGFFSSVDFQFRNNIARLTALGKVDPTFDPGTGPNDAVYAITFQRDGKALVGGVFTSYNGTRRLGLTRLFLNGTVDTSFLDTAHNQFAGLVNSFNLESPNFVNSIALESGINQNVLIGGSFKQLGGSRTIQDGAVLLSLRTRADKRIRYNVARLIGGYTPGPGNVEFRYAQNNIDEGAGNIWLPFRRLDGDLGAASATVSTSSGSAVGGDDFALFGGPVLWRQDNWVATPIRFGKAGESYFGVPITPDSAVEGDEPFGALLSEPVGTLDLGGEIIPTGLALGRAASSVTIVDDDFNHGSLVFASPTYSTNENAPTLTFRLAVVRTNGNDGLVTVRYFTRDLTALAGLDYYATNGTLTFPDGNGGNTVQTQYVNVTLRDDFNIEPDESFIVVLTNATGGAILPGGAPNSTATATATIIDNDLNSGRASFAVSSYSTNESASVAQITLVRQGGNVGQLSVSVAATSGSATAGSDFVGTTNVITWVTGDSTPKTFNLSLLGDIAVEGNETVNLRLFSPSPAGATGTVNTATLTILEDDLPGQLTFSQPLYDVDERGTNISIFVVRSGGIGGTVTADYQLVPSGSGTNFVPVSGTLSLGPGVTAASFDVSVVNNIDVDDTNELAATLVLSNFNPSGAHGVITNALLRIVDDEAVGDPAGLSDTTFDAQAGGTNAIYGLLLQPDGRLIVAGEFPTLNRRPRVRVGRLNEDGSLDGGFNALAGPNAAVRAVALQPVDGRILIAGFFTQVQGTNRNHIARLLPDGTLDRSFNPGSGADNPIYSMLLMPDGRIVIGGSFVSVNGIPRPGVALLLPDGTVDPTFNPGTGVDGTVFALALQADGKLLIGGEFASFNNVARPRIARINLDGSLDASFDPLSGPNGTVRAIAIQADGRILAGGSFTDFNGTARGRLVRLNATGSVDSTFLVAVSGANADVLAIALQFDGKIVVTGDFTQFNGVTRNRITRLNRNGKTDATINFGSGANAFVAAVAVQPDRKLVLGGAFSTYNEEPRRGIVRIHGGTIAGPGSLEFASPEFPVRESGTNAVITVRRVGGTTGDVTVDYAVSDGTAQAGIHYQSVSGTLSFPEGETYARFLLPVIDNSSPNGDLTADLSLLNFTGGVVAGPQPVATLRILDDEGSVGFALASFSVSEGAQSQQALISVRRAGTTNSPLSVNFSTVTGGTATPFADYIPTNGTLLFLPGEATKLFAVRVVDDLLVEGNETVRLQLSGVGGGNTIGLADATLSIVDNEFSAGQFVFSAPSYTAVENAGSVSVTVLRTNGSTGIASVQYQTVGGSATPGIDFETSSNVLAFADGEVAKTIQVPVLDDLLVEISETFSLVLVNPTGNATLGSVSNALVTVLDNDVSLIIPAGSTLISESINPPNGIIDPNETVTVAFALRNVGSGNTSNLVATLLAGSGVSLPSAPQSYGALLANGPAVAQQFSFRAVGNVGDRLVATLQLTDGGTTNGVATFAFTLGGQASRNFTNSGAITINDDAPASPYPSTISVANLGGTITSISVTLTNFSHAWPNDVDVLLVGPLGQRVMLMSDAGTNQPVSNLTLSFSDSATNTLPLLSRLFSRTYRPANYAAPGFNTSDRFPLPAPQPVPVTDPSPYTNTSLAVFNGTNPNGTWSLYVMDDTSLENGSIGGWSLAIQTSDPVSPAAGVSVADLAISASAPSISSVVGVNSTCVLTVTNRGPAAASAASVLGQLPSGLSLVSATPSVGTWSKVQNTLTWNLGQLPSGGSATLTIVTKPLVVAQLTSSVVVSANQIDPSTGNNSLTLTTSAAAVPVLTISRLNNTLVLSWPANSGFKLQSADSLQGPAWVDVGATPQVNAQGQNVVTLGLAPSGRFFRLRSP